MICAKYAIQTVFLLRSQKQHFNSTIVNIAIVLSVFASNLRFQLKITNLKTSAVCQEIKIKQQKFKFKIFSKICLKF